MCVCNFIYKMIGNDLIGIRIVISREIDHLWTKTDCDLVKIVSHTYFFFDAIDRRIASYFIIRKTKLCLVFVGDILVFVICLMYSFWQVDNK